MDLSLKFFEHYRIRTISITLLLAFACYFTLNSMSSTTMGQTKDVLKFNGENISRLIETKISEQIEKASKDSEFNKIDAGELIIEYFGKETLDNLHRKALNNE